jgi:hypothetical protein
MVYRICHAANCVLGVGGHTDKTYDAAHLLERFKKL